MNKLIVAGGCFWGVEAYFAQLKGVKQTRVGYIDGNKANPTYEEVCNGRANHAEAVEIHYDELSLESILDHYFRITIETVFFMTKTENAFISSSMVREVHRLGGDVSAFVPEVVIAFLDQHKDRR